MWGEGFVAGATGGLSASAAPGRAGKLPVARDRSRNNSGVCGGQRLSASSPSWRAFGQRASKSFSPKSCLNVCRTNCSAFGRGSPSSIARSSIDDLPWRNGSMSGCWMRVRAVVAAGVAPGFQEMGLGQMPGTLGRRLVVILCQMDSGGDLLQGGGETEIGRGVVDWVAAENQQGLDLAGLHVGQPARELPRRAKAGPRRVRAYSSPSGRRCPVRRRCRCTGRGLAAVAAVRPSRSLGRDEPARSAATAAANLTASADRTLGVWELFQNRPPSAPAPFPTNGTNRRLVGRCPRQSGVCDFPFQAVSQTPRSGLLGNGKRWSAAAPVREKQASTA